MSIASKKRKQLEREGRLLKEGRDRQAKYAKMNSLNKCGHCKAQFMMFDSLKNQKVFKINRYTKGQIGEVITTMGSRQ